MWWDHLSVDVANIGAIALPATKMGKIRGAVEVVSIDDAMVGLLIRKVHSAAASGKGPVLSGSRSAFRGLFCRLLRQLNLERFDFRPYSLRRGGASHDFASHGDIARTVWRGRWSDSRTARVYVTDGLARLISQNLSAEEAAYIANCQQLFLHWLYG